MHYGPCARKNEKGTYDGEMHGALWERETTNSLATRVPEMVAATEWAERQESMITEAELRGFDIPRQCRQSVGGDKPTDLKVLGHHLRGVLQRQHPRRLSHQV